MTTTLTVLGIGAAGAVILVGLIAGFVAIAAHTPCRSLETRAMAGDVNAEFQLLQRTGRMGK